MNTKNPEQLVQKPHRIRHSYTQSINAEPDEVFPLLCPVRELDWAPGWQPDWVISECGLVEQGCVFQTPGDDSHKTETATWVVTRHDPAGLEVEMLKIIPQHTVTKLQVSLQADGQGRTRSTVVYEYTALGPEGRRFVDNCDQAWYEKLMHHWETAMNHYLA